MSLSSQSDSSSIDASLLTPAAVAPPPPPPPIPYEYLLASNAAYTPSLAAQSGLTPLLNVQGNQVTINQGATVGYAYLDANKNVIVAFEGTQGGISSTATSQFYADGQIEEGQDPTQIAALTGALSFMTSVSAAAQAQGISASSIYVTGHSLGGVMAEYVSEIDGYSGASFGATGIPGLGTAGLGIGKFVNYINGGDPVGNYSSDGAESSFLGNSFYHYGAVTPTGSSSAQGFLTNEAQGFQAELTSNSMEGDPAGSYALYALSQVSDYHGMSSYAASMGYTLPQPPQAAIGVSPGELLIPLMAGLGQDGQTDRSQEALQPNGSLATPDFNITENSNGTATVTQNQAIPGIAGQSVFAPITTTTSINSSGEISSLTDRNQNQQTEDTFTEVSSGGSQLTVYDWENTEFYSSYVVNRNSTGALTSQTVNADGGAVDSIAFSSSGTPATIATYTSSGDLSVKDSGASVLLGAGTTLDLSGSGNITTDTTTDIIFLNGTGDTVNGQSGDLLAMAAGSTATVTGNSQTVDLNGTGDTVTATGSLDNVQDYGASEVVSGNGVTINIDLTAGGQTLNATGSGDAIKDYGSNDSANASGDAFTLSGSQTFNLAGNNDAVTDSTSDNLNLTGTGATIAGTTSDLLDLEAGSSATLSGNGQTVDLVGNSASLKVTGSGDDVQDYDSGESVSGTGVTINLDATNGGQGLTTTGSGDAIDDYGNGNTLNGSNDALTFSKGSETLYLNGSGDTSNGQSGDTLDLSANSSVTANGNSQTIGLDANGDSVITDGSGDTVNDFGSAETVGGTTVSINIDASGSLTANTSGDTLNDAVSSETVGGNSLNIGLDGSSDQTLDATGVQDTIGENSNGDNVTSSYNFIDLSGGTSGTHTETLSIEGTGNAVGATAYDNVTLTGNNNTLNANGTGDTVNDVGSGNTVSGNAVSIGLDTDNNESLTATGTGDSIGENTSGDLVTGSKENVYLSGGASASQIQTITVDGNGDATTAGKNDTLAVNGSTDKAYLTTDDTAFVSGTVSQINSDGYAGVSGDRVVFNNQTTDTSQLQEVDPTSSTSLGSFEYSATNAGGKLDDASYNNNSGTSDVTFYNPSSTVTIETEDYTGLNDTGNRTYLTFDNSSGDVYDDSFIYSGSTLEDYYQTVDNSKGSELSEEELNASGTVVDDIYGSGSYGGYTPNPSGGYGVYDAAVGVAAASGTNISSIATSGSGSSTVSLQGYRTTPLQATFAPKSSTSANSSSASSTAASSTSASSASASLTSASSTSASSTSATTIQPLSAAQIAAIDSAAQSRMSVMIQAMAGYGAESNSLQTSIQTALNDLHEPVLAATAS